MCGQDPDPTSPLSLLLVEMEVLWDLDDRGRLTGEAPPLAVAESDEGCAALVGAGVSDDLAEELGRLAALPTTPGQPPVAVSRGGALLAGVCGPTVASAAPSYLVGPGTAYTSSARILTHADPASDIGGLLRDGNPEGWPASEWLDLLEGRLGPWAMAYEEGQVIAVCHTPVASGGGAEAGVWTRPGFRGRGHAAAVTAHWARSFPPGRHLFYSTTSDNRSSRRVASRLGLRPLGRVWRLSRPGEEGTHASRPWP
jgi:hypothetical protein